MDQQHMERIYEENVSVVYKYLFCLTQNVDTSEELTQETFYQAIKGLNRFRGDCKVSVWLCQIAKRLWYKDIKKRKNETVSIDDGADQIVSDENIEENYWRNVKKVDLFRQLHQFDPVMKEVMYLRLTGELSFSEIGDILGKTENWARVTFYRGKQKLVKGRETWDKN